jgi:hypothetical protein
MPAFGTKHFQDHFRLLSGLAEMDAKRLNIISSVEEAVEQILRKRLPQKLVIGGRDEVRTENSVEEIPGRSASFAPEFTVTLLVPYTGDPELLTLVPTSRPMFTVLNQVQVRTTNAGSGRVTLTLTGQLTAAQINENADDLIRLLQDQAQQINREVDGFETMLRNQLEQWVQQRSTALGMLSQVKAELTIPVFRADEGEKIPIPVTPRNLSLAEREPAQNAETQWVLEDEIYREILRIIASTIRAMERTPTVANLLIQGVLDEEGLRNLMLIVLNANYKGAAAGEVFNGDGKTDILLRWHDKNAFIGECKFWDGQAKFTAALDQLFGYTVWRDTKAALVLFISEQNATKTITKARQAMESHECYEASEGEDADGNYHYIVHSSKDPLRKISLALVSVVLKSGVPGILVEDD